MLNLEFCSLNIPFFSQFDKRVYLYALFSEVTFDFLLRVSLGIGNSLSDGDYVRKSISHERTFRVCCLSTCNWCNRENCGYFFTSWTMFKVSCLLFPLLHAQELSDRTELLEKCKSLCEAVSRDMQKNNCKVRDYVQILKTKEILRVRRRREMVLFFSK